MVPRFLFPEGLLLLLTIPFFLFLHKRRSRPRTVTSSLFPLIEKLTERYIPPRSIFRPSRRTRALLICASIVFLSLSASGLNLDLRRYPPGEWLVVMDNTYSLNAANEHGSIKDHFVMTAGNIAGSVQVATPFRC